MDFKLTKEAVCVNELIYEGNIEQAVDSDITLPDYCPDILRILKCTITPSITATGAVGDRVTAEGNAIVRILYVSEDNLIRCYEQSYPFSKHVEVSGLGSDATACVKARAQYVNCRAVSPRRVDIHGTLLLCFKVMGTRSEEIVSDVSGGGVQLKCREMELSNAVGNTERAFVLNEVAEIGQSKPPVAQIIRTDAVVDSDDIKVIRNKLLIKGQLRVITIYCADNNDGEIESMEHSMPISQIIELEGIDEECINDTALNVIGLEITPKSDSGGELRLLEIEARVSAVICAYKEIFVSAAQDSYSTQYEMKAEEKVLEIPRAVGSIQDICLCSSHFDVGSGGISKMLDMWCSDVTSLATVRDGGIVIAGTATVSMLILDSEGQPAYLERQADYEHIHTPADMPENIRCEPEVRVRASNYVINSAERVDVRIELAISALIFTASSHRCISDITLLEEQKKTKPSASLTIYFSDSGESVWDIARRYNTTVEAILDENDLSGEIVSDKRMLLIPCI